MKRMTNIRRVVGLLWIAASLSGQAFAQTASTAACAQEPKTNIYFINGINNSEVDMIGSLVAMESTMLGDPGITAFFRTSQVSFRLIENPSANWFLDGLESARQFATGAASNVLSYGLGAINFLGIETSDLADRVMGRPPKMSPEDRYATYVATANKFYEAIPQVLPAISARLVVEKYGPEILASVKSGENALIVAHSQGNLFATEIYAFVVQGLATAEEQSRIKILNVASPSLLYPSGEHLLYEDDLAINTPFLLRGGTRLPDRSSVPAVTFDNPIANKLDALARVAKLNDQHFDEPMGHNFVQVYLENKNSMLPGGLSHSELFNQKALNLLKQMPNGRGCDYSATITGVWSYPSGRGAVLAKNLRSVGNCNIEELR